MWGTLFCLLLLLAILGVNVATLVETLRNVTPCRLSSPAPDRSSAAAADGTAREPPPFTTLHSSSSSLADPVTAARHVADQYDRLATQLTTHLQQTAAQLMLVHGDAADDRPLDAVIALGPRDYDVGLTAVESLRRHCLHLRHVYLISATDPHWPDTVWIDERGFPFTRDDLQTTFRLPPERSGWYLQQLLKLYAAEVIPDLCDHFLVWDADTVLLKPTVFVRRDRALFSYTTDQHHTPYFEHMARLSPDLTRVSAVSGICNFMVLNRWSLRRLFHLVETTGPSPPDPFWRRFLRAVDPAYATLSGASEFELYFNYMHRFEPDRFTLRPLLVLNDCASADRLTDQERATYDLVSCHWYRRAAAT